MCVSLSQRMRCLNSSRVKHVVVVIVVLKYPELVSTFFPGFFIINNSMVVISAVSQRSNKGTRACGLSQIAAHTCLPSCHHSILICSCSSSYHAQTPVSILPHLSFCQPLLCVSSSQHHSVHMFIARKQTNNDYHWPLEPFKLQYTQRPPLTNANIQQCQWRLGRANCLPVAAPAMLSAPRVNMK